MAVTTRAENGKIIISSTGKPDRVFPVFSTGIKGAQVVAGHLIVTLTDNTTVDAGPFSVVGIASISPTGLVTLSDNTTYQLTLPVTRNITSVSEAGLITFSDGGTQQLALPVGSPGLAAPIYAAIAGSDFNIAVAVSGVTALPNIPANADAVVVSYSGGDCYVTTTGTSPTSSSLPYSDGTQVEIDPRAEVLAYQAIVKSGSPRLIGYYERRIN